MSSPTPPPTAAANPAAPVVPAPDTPGARPPATPSSKAPSHPRATSKSAPAAPATPLPVAAPATLDLTSLEQRLRDTHAIGVFTKLSLKNQVDDLLGVVRTYHGGQGKVTLQDARQRYDLLLLKVLSLLQDGDPALAADVRGSREAIWNLLADPVQFNKLR